MRRGIALALIVPLSGCIPPSAAPPTRGQAAPESTDAPRIDAEIDTLFDEQPVWEARPAIADPIESKAGEYIVQPGDTLRAIGEKTGAGSEMIARENALVAPFIIRPGQVLKIPPGRFHKVAAGDTGIAVAQAYGVPWADIVAANALGEPYILRVGQRLLLPSGAAAQPPSIEARAAAFSLDIDAIITGGEPAIESGLAIARPDATPGKPLPPDVTVVAPPALTGGFVWPAAGRIVQRFGPAGEGAISQGIDIAVMQRAEIRAAADGIVAFVGDNVANYGGLILIRHGNGWITAYGRASEALVTRGQKVTRGQPIGRAGTGSAPRLFFQMRKDRVPVDPLRQLPQR